MVDRLRLIGETAASGARRVAWDQSGRSAVTLSDDNRLVGLNLDTGSWSVAARARPTLTWTSTAPTIGVLGTTLLFEGDGNVRVHPAGADLYLAHGGTLVAAHIDGRRVELVAPDGSIVDRFEAEHVAWHPERNDLLYGDAGGICWRRSGRREAIVDDTGDRGPLLARTSAAGSSMIVWGRYGPFDVLADDGTLSRSFPAHLGEANLAAAIGTTIVVTSGDDGRIVIHDLVRGGIHAALDVPSPVVRIDLDSTDRFACVELLDRRHMIIDVEEADVLDGGRRFDHASWSPFERTLACVDGQALWLTSFD